MIQKHPLCPQRLRQVPKQFSWLDQRLVRDRYIEHVSHQAAALYLFLVTVADSQGVSFYSDISLTKRLSLDEPTLEDARRHLAQAIGWSDSPVEPLPLFYDVIRWTDSVQPETPV